MADAIIELRRIEEVTVLTLSAGKANAFDPPLLEALDAAVARAIADGARALVITGEGHVFSGGLALPTLITYTRARMLQLMSEFARAMRTVLEAPVPVVAALNGNAIAGGCVLALMCDARVMIARTEKRVPRIGLNEAQLGLGLPAVVLEPARARVPLASHTRVMLEGRLFEPTEARAAGLVDEVVAPERFESRVLERARELSSAAPLAYAQIKRALLRPIVDAIERTQSSLIEPWLDTWFSDEGQRRLHAALARIGRGSPSSRGNSS